jgi:putative hemolysin
VVSLGDRTWSVDGRLPLTDLEEILNHEFACEEACDTVGGYAYWAFGRIPEVNDKIEKDGIVLHILAMDGRRVSRVQITENTTPSEDDEIEDMSGVLTHGSR